MRDWTRALLFGALLAGVLAAGLWGLDERWPKSDTVDLIAQEAMAARR